jgi:hypothetical protein
LYPLAERVQSGGRCVQWIAKLMRRTVELIFAAYSAWKALCLPYKLRCPQNSKSSEGDTRGQHGVASFE